MAGLTIRILLAPSFVVAVSLATRRFGARLGGVLAGLPVIAGPILLVLALEHGSGFASRAATGVLLGMVGLAAFALAYVAAATYVPWPGALAAAYAAFAAAVLALRLVSLPPLVAFAVACAALALTVALLPRPPKEPHHPVPHPRWDLPVRAGCTTAVVLTVTAVAGSLGPHLSGLLTAFPVVTAVLSAFAHARAGRDETVRLLRGFAFGFFTYAAFCLLVATTVRPLGIAACFLLATAVAFAAQAAALAASRDDLREADAAAAA